MFVLPYVLIYFVNDALKGKEKCSLKLQSSLQFKVRQCCYKTMIWGCPWLFLGLFCQIPGSSVWVLQLWSQKEKAGWWWPTTQCSESPACASSVEQGNSSLLPLHPSEISKESKLQIITMEMSHCINSFLK